MSFNKFHKKSKPSVETYFNKVFHFHRDETSWGLPERVFEEDKWLLEELQEKKKRLNEVKAKLNNFDLKQWSLHTKQRDPSTSIIRNIRHNFQPELLTQAWCKFYECLSKHDIIPSEAVVGYSLRSLHLCEAPGGFISALNHFLTVNYPNIKLDWRANTLNPDYEGNPLNQMIPDDRLINHTKPHWLFGADHTGDITKYYNYQAITNEILQTGKVLLVTADGSVDCMDDPGDQERNVEHLHYCEVITALTVLAEGGSFVLKIFTTFEESTICLLYLLSSCFEQMKIFKPITSKSGNSETYVICTNYKPPKTLLDIWTALHQPYKAPNQNSMFKLFDIPEGFIRQIMECADFFMEKQIYTISENIKYFVSKGKKFGGEFTRIRNFHREVRNYFLDCYNMQAIMGSERLVPNIEDLSLHENFQPCENYLFQCSYDKEKEIQVNFTIGKRITKVLYTKICPQNILDSFCFKNKREDFSLFEKTKKILSEEFIIFDVSCINFIDFSEFQRELFFKIYQNLHKSKNFLFINVPFITNVLASILYVLCNSFKVTYFCKSGIIYTKGFVNDKRVSEFFEGARQKYLEVQEVYADFEVDIVEIIKDVNLPMKCLWFYHCKLPTRKFEIKS